MGGGSWSNDAYKSSSKGRDAFKTSDAVLSKPRNEQKADEQLSPFGLVCRESRDNEEHPNSNAIAVGLDITGSMSSVVVEIQSNLGKLMGMLIEYGIIEDPQLLFYAIGDEGEGDPIPFQISQFESDIRINDQLKKIVLVGRGGGNLCESYELGHYAMARHTALDCFEKRGRKGYLIKIGDECAYGVVKAKEVKKIFDAQIGEDIALKTVVKEVTDKFNVLHIIPAGSSHFNNPKVRNFWTNLMGKNRVVYPRAEIVCETIAMFIGLTEGKFDLAGGIELITKTSSKKVAEEVAKVLADYAETLGPVTKLTSPKNGSGKSETKIDPNTGKPNKGKPGRLF